MEPVKKSFLKKPGSMSSITLKPILQKYAAATVGGGWRALKVFYPQHSRAQKIWKKQTCKMQIDKERLYYVKFGLIKHLDSNWLQREALPKGTVEAYVCHIGPTFQISLIHAFNVVRDLGHKWTLKNIL